MLIELIQVALGFRKQLSHIPSEEEWMRVYKDAMSQAIAGVCFTAIQKLPAEQCPPEEIYWEWLGLVSQIQQQNELIDKRTAKVWKKLKEAGLDAAVLKGQGIATLYKSHTDSIDSTNNTDDLPTLRQSGDIDVWVKGGYQKVCDYVQSVAPTIDLAYHRFSLNVFADTEVELHHRPTLMRNLFDNRKLARWYNSFGADSFIYLEDKGFAVPSNKFNTLFILTHIYRHFLFEGIGLRQVMDYYFVLRNNPALSLEKGGEILLKLRELRLLRFAEAMMWVLHTQFGLEERYLICGMNEKEGRFVLNEILMTGNFGRGETRYHYKRLRTFRRMTVHGCHLLLHYPSEVIWTPVWLLYHKYWMWNKKRQIKRRYGQLSSESFDELQNFNTEL